MPTCTIESVEYQLWGVLYLIIVFFDCYILIWGLSFFKMSSGDMIRVIAPLRGKIARVDVNSCACVSGCQGGERGNF